MLRDIVNRLLLATFLAQDIWIPIGLVKESKDPVYNGMFDWSWVDGMTAVEVGKLPVFWDVDSPSTISGM